jgi:ATP-dependent Clp protease ATP-binding subunit ClpC
MEVLSTSSPLTLHSHRLLSASSSSSHVTSIAASSLSSFASSYLGISLSNRTIHRFSTTPTNLRRFPQRKRKKFTPISAVFERFTERAIRAIIFSQKEAKSLGKDMVYTQHLLLGLIAEDRDPQGFLGSGITIDKAREAVWSIWDEANSDSKQEEASSTSYSKSTDMPFSISTKRVFEAAVEYSRTMDCQYIAPEHIAVGLFTVDDGSAGRVLKRLGANMNLLTAAALTRLKGEIAKDGREPSSSSKGSFESPPSGRIAGSGPGGKKAKNVLEQFCVDLTARASEGLIDPVIGREKEVQRVIQILCRRTKNNPILLGEAGVGKTAIAEGLAISIAEASAPGFLLVCTCI